MDIPVRIIGILALICVLPYGVIYVSVSELFVEFIGLIIYITASNKVIGYTFTEVFSDFFFNIFQACVMGFGVYYLGLLFGARRISTLIAQMVAGLVIYLALSIFTNNKNYRYIISTIKNL